MAAFTARTTRRFTGTLSGVQNGDAISVTYATEATAANGVGVYPIVVTLVDPNGLLGNYTVTKTDGTLTVNPASLTVTANDASRIYGESNPPFDGTVTGLANSDPITVSYSSAATASYGVGTCPIVPALSDPNGLLSNYSLTINNGTLTVNPAPLTVTANDATRLYGAHDPGFERPD